MSEVRSSDHGSQRWSSWRLWSWPEGVKTSFGWTKCIWQGYYAKKWIKLLISGRNGGSNFLHETIWVKKSTNFGDFQPFFVIFSPISSLSHIYYTNSEDKSAITWFSWSQWRLKLFTSAQGGLPPPTQLTNRNIQRWEISVSWGGQSTTYGPEVNVSEFHFWCFLRGYPTWPYFFTYAHMPICPFWA